MILLASKIIITVIYLEHSAYSRLYDFDESDSRSRKFNFLARWKLSLKSADFRSQFSHMFLALDVKSTTKRGKTKSHERVRMKMKTENKWNRRLRQVSTSAKLSEKHFNSSILGMLLFSSRVNVVVSYATRAYLRLPRDFFGCRLRKFVVFSDVFQRIFIFTTFLLIFTLNLWLVSSRRCDDNEILPLDWQKIETWDKELRIFLFPVHCSRFA